MYSVFYDCPSCGCTNKVDVKSKQDNSLEQELATEHTIAVDRFERIEKLEKELADLKIENETLKALRDELFERNQALIDKSLPVFQKLQDLKQLVREFRKAYGGDSAMDECNSWHRLSQSVPDVDAIKEE